MSAPVQISLKSFPFGESDYAKDAWLVLLHAKRTPPHVGLLINGIYNSLTIKGQELDVALEVLLKTISQRKIETVFIKLKQHPVFSRDYQLDILREIIKRSGPVKQFENTCLSPVKIFFREFYAIDLLEEELLFDFIARLNNNKFLDHFTACYFESQDSVLEVPFYSAEDLNERIKNERLAINKT